MKIGIQKPVMRKPKKCINFNLAWKKDSKPITKALVGDEVTLCADTHNIADGTSATIKIVEKDDDGNDDDVVTLLAKVQNNKIECAWKVVYTADNDDTDSEQVKKEKGYTLPEYAFTIECDGEKSTESGELDVRGGMKVRLVDRISQEPLKNRNYVIYFDSITKHKIIQEGKSDSDGCIEINEINYISFKIDIEEL